MADIDAELARIENIAGRLKTQSAAIRRSAGGNAPVITGLNSLDSLLRDLEEAIRVAKVHAP